MNELSLDARQSIDAGAIHKAEARGPPVLKVRGTEGPESIAYGQHIGGTSLVSEYRFLVANNVGESNTCQYRSHVIFCKLWQILNPTSLVG